MAKKNEKAEQKAVNLTIDNYISILREQSEQDELQAMEIASNYIDLYEQPEQTLTGIKREYKAKLLPDGDPRHRTVVNKRMGKESITNFKLLGTVGPYSWIQADPVTGRTHQIRAHLQDLGISIVCDPLYSGNQKPVRLSDIKRSYRGDVFEERPLLARLGLHAYQLSVVHPETKERMTFTAPYHRDMDALRKQLFKLYKVDPLAQSEEAEVPEKSE